MNRSLVCSLLLLLAPLRCVAQTTVVSTEAQLRNALTNAVDGETILFANSITLTTGDLPNVQQNITVDGGGFTLSGNNQFRGLLVMAFDPDSPGLLPVSAAIRNITISDAVAAGGSGGAGTIGGGGGAGLGGALFVGDLATVTISNVNFASNTAAGGSGGAGAAGIAPAGGGGMAGNGGLGDSGGGAGGGGGGAGRGANGGRANAPNGGAGMLIYASPGGSSLAGSGGVQAGGGAVGGVIVGSVPIPEGGAGGGAGAGAAAGGAGGAGGFGGGSGGASTGGVTSGGGFGGGGGGGAGGNGGYGGGAGGGGGNSAGYFGGSGTASGGGGGAGLGGAVFVQSGGTLSMAGNLSVNGNAVAPGAGASGAGSGTALGAGFFTVGGGTLTFMPNGAETQTVADAITDHLRPSGGSPAVTKNGSGTLNLWGANTFTGSVAVNAGTLSLASGSNLGFGPRLQLADATTVNFTASNSFVQAVTIAGTSSFRLAPAATVTWSGGIIDAATPGSLNIIGGGTLSLTNSFNGFSGGTTIREGSTLVIGSNGALGGGGLAIGDAATSGTLAVASGSSVSSSRAVVLGGAGAVVDAIGSSSLTLNGVVSGSGGLTKNGVGVVTLGGSNTYSGGTVINGGILRAGAVNVFGSGSMTVAAGTLDLNGFNQTFGAVAGSGLIALGSATLTAGGSNASTSFGGAVAGAGGVVKAGSGTWTLTGANSYTGGTTVGGGTLAGTTTGLQGAIVNNANVTFDQPFNGTYAGAMSGSGSLTKAGGGILTLTGANTYSGGTTISGGTLIGNTASLQGNFTNNASLIFDQGSDGVFGGVISGSGTLRKNGAGRLDLIGAHTLTGLTTVAQGTLGMSGSLAGSVLVNAGAVYSGGGTIGGNLTVNGGAASLSPLVLGAGLIRNGLSPRSATAFIPSTLVVRGDLAVINGGILALTLFSPTEAPIAVEGSMRLADATLDLTVNDTELQRVLSFLAITAAQGLSVSNTSIALTSPFPNLRSIFTLDKTSLRLTLVNPNAPLEPSATTPNGESVGAALDRIRPLATGDLGLVVDELALLTDDALDEALKSIAGEIHGSQIQLAALDSETFTDSVRDEIAARGDEEGPGAAGVASTRPQWWAEIQGEQASFDTADGSSGGDAIIGGTSLGIDRNVTDNWYVGGGGGYSRGSLDLDTSGATSDVRVPRAFAYAGFDPPGRWALSFGGSGARASYDTRRRIAFASSIPGVQAIPGGVDREAESVQRGTTTDVWGEYQDTFKVKTYTYDARVGWRYARYGRGGWRETGAQSLSLRAADQAASSKQADIRITARRHVGAIRPHALLTFKRELGDGETATDVQLTDSAQSAFVVEGLKLARNMVTARGGVSMRSGLGAEYTLDYQVRHAIGQTKQSVHFRVRFK